MEFWGINIYYWIIFLPIAGGLLGFIINRLRTELNFVAFVGALYFAIRIFLKTRGEPIFDSLAQINGFNFRFYLDNLTGFILLFVAISSFLVWLYSLKAMSKKPREKVFYLYLSLTLAAANAVVLSGNLIFLFIFWNLLVFSLYGMLQVAKGDHDSSFAARKAITIIGIADYALMLGIVILLVVVGDVDFPVVDRIALNNPWLITSYILIMIGALAKLGTMPLHTWIPESAKVVPASTLAFIPGSIDKLLGVYLLIRVSYFIFDISGSMPLRILLMVIGVVSIVVMAVAALIQKDAQRLLAFSTVSQAGYMVLGIGTGMPIAIAGALFHMLNNVLYKSVLFMTVGSVENRTRTTDMALLGGLGTKMPVALFAFVIAVLAISGVPPFNGFYSKWMIYQGIIGLSNQIPLWFIFLICAMFGSVLTLAYSLKLLHAIFLGHKPKALNKVREARFVMVVPSLVLSLACIVFGVFANVIPLKVFVLPSLPFKIGNIGFWSPSLATILIIVGIILGLIIFLIGTVSKPKKSAVFVGGEVLDEDETRVTGVGFYSSLRTLDMLDKTYNFSEGGAFDFYNYLQGAARGFAYIFKNVINHIIVGIYRSIGKLVRGMGSLTSSIHTGELYNYVGWIFLGGIILMLLLTL
jgi:NADH:ubiquinone oxidoreductase subunit 5 (subunit L)/multisubunit Na+/H+ antiporter MnhA subunit